MTTKSCSTVSEPSSMKFITIALFVLTIGVAATVANDGGENSSPENDDWGWQKSKILALNLETDYEHLVCLQFPTPRLHPT